MFLCFTYTQIFRRIIQSLIYVYVHDSLHTTAAAATRHPPTHTYVYLLVPHTHRSFVANYSLSYMFVCMTLYAPTLYAPQPQR